MKVFVFAYIRVEIAFVIPICNLYSDISVIFPMRLDKWLWCVRVFKTRTLAGDACKGGKIKLNGEAGKAAKELKAGDEITFKWGVITKKIRVTDFPKNRVAGKKVEDYYTDLTAPEEYERLKMMKEMGPPVFFEGKGRPTKRDRRKLDDIL